MSQRPSKSTSRLAASPVDVTPDPQQRSAGSVARRIQASASGLLRQSLLRPSASSVTGTLASSAADANKGGSGSSSAGPSQTTLSSMFLNIQASLDHNSPDSTSKSNKWESFRSHPMYEENDGHIDTFDFGDFLSQEAGLSRPEPPERPYRGEDVVAGKETLVLRSHSSKASVQLCPAHPDSIPCQSVSKATWIPVDNTDGAAVVALLSDPDLFIDEDPINSSTFETENFANVHTKNQKVDARAATPLNQVSAINPLDLLPDFRRPRRGFNTTRSANLSAATANLPEGYMYDKSQLQLHDGDLQPWLDLLNRYQDEVWGDILPLVQEAREEAKAAKEQIPEDQPATRRLRMLLKHLERPVINKAQLIE